MARCPQRDGDEDEKGRVSSPRGEGPAKTRAAELERVLHNDRNPINRVVWRLWRIIPDLTMKGATRVTWEAHTKGRAVAKTCHKKLAELYEECLRAKGLTVPVEPAR